MFITFDKYYNVNQYNNFLISARNNKIDYVQYISIKPPHHRYLKIDKKYVPNFLNYDICDKSYKKWLISTIIPLYSNEYYFLQRKIGQDNNFEQYVTPKELLNISEENRLIIFKSNSTSFIRNISSQTYDNIFELTKSKEKKYNIYLTTDDSIINEIGNSNILMSFNNIGIYHNETIPKYYELEYLLNYYIFNKYKIENKTYKLSYWRNGQYFPIKTKKQKSLFK